LFATIKRLEAEKEELESRLRLNLDNDALDERIRLEKAIFEISSHFIGDYELDDSIYKSFHLMGSLAGADRIYMYRFHQKAKLMHITHECILGDPGKIKGSYSSIPYDDLSWWLGEIRSKEIAYIEDARKMPDAAATEKKYLLEQGVRTVIAFPVRINSKIEGFMGMDHLSESRKWSEQDMQIYKIAADIIGYAIERRRNEKSLLQTEQMYESIYENTGGATLTLKPDTTILMVNSEFERLTGYRKDEVENKKKLINLTDRNHRSKVQKYFLLMMSNPLTVPENYEFDYLTSDGETRNAYMTGSTLINDKTAVLSFIDVTEFKITEKQLVIAKEKSEESERLKSAFLANVSHEIRTPLNAITGFSGLLSNPELPLDKREKYIKQIMSGGNELVSLIDNVPDISRIESGTLKPKISEVFVNLKLKELYHFFEDIKQQHGKSKLEISLKLPPGSDDFIIRTDQLRLQQIFTNLIDNATKITSSGTIEFGYSNLLEESEEIRSNSVLFYVKDTGIGIAKKDKEKVFERFVKIVDKIDFLHRGAGLGLTLCRDLVHLLKGEIWVESALGKGSTFYFTLPIQKSKAKERSAQLKKARSWDLSEKTILIAEDTESNYLYLREILGSTNVRIIRAKDGKEAIDLFREHKDSIDFIFMDILMPEYDGYEATHRIRDIKEEVIVVAQTAFAFEGELENGLYAGCFNDHILKPFELKTIRYLLEKYLVEQEDHS